MTYCAMGQSVSVCVCADIYLPCLKSRLKGNLHQNKTTGFLAIYREKGRRHKPPLANHSQIQVWLEAVFLTEHFSTR